MNNFKKQLVTRIQDDPGMMGYSNEGAIGRIFSCDEDKIYLLLRDSG